MVSEQQISIELPSYLVLMGSKTSFFQLEIC